MNANAVLGGGILGLVTALLLASRDEDVVLFERHGSLWTGASAVGEGKVHLGAVYALGDVPTRRRMLDGGLSFASIIEAALEGGVDWEAICSETFVHLVAPGSLVGVRELSRLYRDMNEGLEEVDDRTYLGREVDYIVDPKPVIDQVTGLTCFSCVERSVDPNRLGELLVEAVAGHPRVEVRTGTPVTGINTVSGTVSSHDRHGAEVLSEPFERVFNCTWEGRQAIEQASGVRELALQNTRVKGAVILKPRPADRSVTLVQGPFGDVVAHESFTYASWYPVGRRHCELEPVTSPEAVREQQQAGESARLAQRQHEALAALGLLAPDAEVIGHEAGFILGDGELDIDSPHSQLHSRGRAGCRTRGRLITPLNYKFSTAPLAAMEACQAALSLTYA